VVFIVDIPSSQVHILDGNAADLIAECQAYEKLIKSYNGVELFLGGIGEDGHIAFNEPGIDLVYGSVVAFHRGKVPLSLRERVLRRWHMKLCLPMLGSSTMTFQRCRGWHSQLAWELFLTVEKSS
jgi:glucosamine-6-phosphate deaminase